MSKFTVYFAEGGDREFDEESRYSIDVNGVLEIVGPDRQRLRYSPTAWHHVADQVRESTRGARAAVRR